MTGRGLRASSRVGLLLLSVGIGGSMRAGKPASGVPAIIAGGPDQGGQPVWVSAGAASADGALRLDMFGDASRRNLEEQVRHIAEARKTAPPPDHTPRDLQPVMERAPYLSEELCLSSSIVFSHPQVPRDSFEALVRHARDIVGGRVVAIDQGFVNGLPSSMLEVELDTVLRSSGDFAASRTLYVVHPYAVFRIGNTAFCRKEPAYPYRPQIGDRVLLFPASAPIDAHDMLVWPEAEEVVAEKPEGGLVVGRSLQGEKPFADFSVLDELIQRLRGDLER